MTVRYTQYSHQQYVRHWSIAPQFDGMRADLYLTYYLKKISRTKAQRMINEGVFTQAGHKLHPSKRLFAHNEVSLRVKTPDSEDDLKDVTVDIVYQDEQLLVVNKPALLALHPSGNYYHRTLTHWLKRTYGPDYPRPCHRLDRETSGLVVCAKTHAAQSLVKKVFLRRKVSKQYLAIVQGNLTRELHICEPLALQGSRGLVRIKMVVDPHGYPSETLVKPVEYLAHSDRSIVLCEPKTGRQHQIRAHLAHYGFPIVGDKLYQMGEEHFNDMTLGKDHAQPEHFRHALHAYTLHMKLGLQEYHFVAPPPADLVQLMGRTTAEVLEHL